VSCRLLPLPAFPSEPCSTAGAGRPALRAVRACGHGPATQRGRSGLGSAWPAWRLTWTLGPPVSDRGSNKPRCKKFPAELFKFLENFRIYLKLVKCIENCLFIRNLCMTYENVQKNIIYLLVSKSCIFMQL
jgi:hypothetical protein